MGKEAARNEPVLFVVFYRTEAGNEPVREWLRSLRREDRKIMGEDIKTAQFGWPLGMPLVRKLEPDIWAVRSSISRGVVRILFTVEGNTMVLLHGFVKKSRRTPLGELDTTRRRLADMRQEYE